MLEFFLLILFAGAMIYLVLVIFGMAGPAPVKNAMRKWHTSMSKRHELGVDDPYKPVNGNQILRYFLPRIIILGAIILLAYLFL